ncbi:hypothetical protein GGR53DRAFT_37545 [Hypoxylon sp. FL1150]|nr:hypothetical protein GGR53DRAFT_37545 [Hypoxylon sp. FL1150]
MSFLDVMIPVRNLENLKHDVYKQFKKGKLRTSDYTLTLDATPRLAKLICLLEQKLSRTFEYFMVVEMDIKNVYRYRLDTTYEEKCVLCLHADEYKAAVWKNTFYKCPIEHNKVLLTNEGDLCSDDCGSRGVYLILWRDIEKPGKPEVLASTMLASPVSSSTVSTPAMLPPPNPAPTASAPTASAPTASAPTITAYPTPNEIQYQLIKLLTTTQDSDGRTPTGLEGAMLDMLDRHLEKRLEKSDEELRKKRKRKSGVVARLQQDTKGKGKAIVKLSKETAQAGRKSATDTEAQKTGTDQDGGGSSSQQNKKQKTG